MDSHSYTCSFLSSSNRELAFRRPVTIYRHWDIPYARTHAHTHARTHAHTHARTHVRTHVCLLDRLIARTHARTRASKHASTHARTCYSRVINVVNLLSRDQFPYARCRLLRQSDGREVEASNVTNFVENNLNASTPFEAGLHATSSFIKLDRLLSVFPDHHTSVQKYMVLRTFVYKMMTSCSVPSSIRCLPLWLLSVASTLYCIYDYSLRWQSNQSGYSYYS